MEQFERIVVAMQTAIMWVGGALLFALVAFAMLRLILPAVWEEVRKYLSLGVVQKLLCATFVLGLFYYGATKPLVRYDGGIKSGVTENLITNDLVQIYWQRNLNIGVYVPESATVYIDYRLSDDTNGVWVSLAETTVGEWGWSGTVANATNYDYNVWAYYIPPDPVHTNGVWVYRTMRDRRNENVIPLRARIEVNGSAIATPKEVRKDEENN